jgi:hypothetical protein
MNVVEAFVVQQPVAMVFAAEAFDFAALMLKHAPVDAVRHANVKRSRTAAHDVNEIRVISHTPIKLVILSEVETLAKPNVSAQSKDPMPAGASTGLARSFYHGASDAVFADTSVPFREQAHF